MKKYFGVAVMASCFAANCCSAIAAEAADAVNAPGTIYHGALQLVLVLFGLAAALVAVRWMYYWKQCRKTTCAATRAVKERVARGEKPYG
ncbi:hypothetical protein [Pseudomonas mosselii]|uniref:hypothetical protein n=1 Tax=Pseudomonas mosselii TaxID=78327 RepID=UPI0021D8CEF8|nr:hypothetical protein [Pseudomonas mosselii]MCU9529372.1 hypothetical protein [Pseudomonas mosselii]MCU9536663.1 hypothetical protein [Pseudomonas mosselii]MCU9542284.1 hypothetical protein [Pseudomonas mosselii]MCU9548388.1 hypothetical protein [Pseudomonas mosselii]